MSDAFAVAHIPLPPVETDFLVGGWLVSGQLDHRLQESRFGRTEIEAAEAFFEIVVGALWQFHRRIEWMEENCNGRYFVAGIHGFGYEKVRLFAFENDNDATMFKLRYG